MAEYYVNNNGGSDDNDGSTEALAFDSLAKAADTVAAGDTVHIKGGTEYTDQDGTNGCNLLISTAGTVTAPITWQGYTTTPGDEGVAVVNASGFSFGIYNSGSDYQVYKNILTKNSANDGFYLNSGNQTLFNCTSSNNGRHGIQSGGNMIYVKCVVNNNGSHGIKSGNYQHMYGCKIHTNSGHQIDGDAVQFIHGCLFYAPSSNACVYASAFGSGIVNCTFDGDGAASSIGFLQGAANTETWSVINCIFMDLATGIQATTDVKQFGFCDFNLFYGVTTTHTNAAAGINDVTGTEDPFTDSSTRDYTLKAGSEALASGIDAGVL